MNIHTCLWNDVTAFDFVPDDLEPIKNRFPDVSLTIHSNESAFLDSASDADILLTWEFQPSWYAQCGALKLIMTPAAGDDWVSPDPSGRVRIVHGSFHGEILAESLLHAILFMNHRMPQMVKNFQEKSWDRNLQADCRLLANQTVLIIGMGKIGERCAKLIAATGAKVIGIRREAASPGSDIPVAGVEKLDEVLTEADHVVLLLPGGEQTMGFMNPERLQRCKKGAYLYNFGRGNALSSADLLEASHHIGGAFLDVTDDEPLPADSPLWGLENIMITPHSSCVYREYRARFINEVIGYLEEPRRQG